MPRTITFVKHSAPELHALEQLVLLDELAVDDARLRVVRDAVLDALDPLPPAA